MDGAMFNSGQCCCGIERIHVHSRHFDRFLDKSVETVAGHALGNPLDQGTTLGPMAQKRFAVEISAQVGEALANGAAAHLEAFRRRSRRGLSVTPNPDRC